APAGTSQERVAGPVPEIPARNHMEPRWPIIQFSPAVPPSGHSGASAPVNPQSYPTFSSQRSGENHFTAKSPPRQISIDGQVLTAFPRVRSSEAFRRRPPILGSTARAGPASQTLPDSGRLRGRDLAARMDPKLPLLAR